MATLIAFFGVWRNQFINYDDNTYVFLNAHVLHGPGRQMASWALTSGYAGNWHPLTWLSHALDCWAYGLNPAGHHISSLALHVTNVLLLFLALHKMTGATWRSVLVAALFGIHPLRVESVAWVAERKDVLSGLFFMLTLLAYTRYVRQQGEAVVERIAPERPEKASAEQSNPEQSSEVSPRPTLSFFLALFCFALGLMSKPMLVTLPFILLLLDFWPLNRFRAGRSPAEGPRLLLALVVEKWPFFALSACSCVITLLAQQEAVQNLQTLPLSARVQNASISYLSYVGRTIWPAGLAIFYPFPRNVSWPKAVAATLCLLLLSLLALVLRKKRPFLPIGWFWYLGMLVPVIGVVQVGLQANADRYTYLPSIGIYLLFSWGLGGIVSAWPRFKIPVASAVVVVLVCLSLATNAQVRVWRNTHDVFLHAAAVTRDNYVALTMLAKEDLEQGKIAAAQTNLQKILATAPRYPSAEYLLGASLQMQGLMEEAIPHLRAAVGPEVGIPAQARMVLSLLHQGRLDEADSILGPLLQMNPGDPNGCLMASALLKEQGHSVEARQVFDRLTAHNPKFMLDNPTMNYELAELYSLQGKTRQAVPYYRKAIELSPTYTNALNNFAWILATDPDDTVRDGATAVHAAERACQLTAWREPVFIGTLAAAYAEAGLFDAATKTAERARDLAQTRALPALAQKNAELLELYRKHKPYREKAG